MLYLDSKCMLYLDCSSFHNLNFLNTFLCLFVDIICLDSFVSLIPSSDPFMHRTLCLKASSNMTTVAFFQTKIRFGFSFYFLGVIWQVTNERNKGDKLSQYKPPLMTESQVDIGASVWERLLSMITKMAIFCKVK